MKCDVPEINLRKDLSPAYLFSQKYDPGSEGAETGGRLWEIFWWE